MIFVNVYLVFHLNRSHGQGDVVDEKNGVVVVVNVVIVKLLVVKSFAEHLYAMKLLVSYKYGVSS